MKVQCIGCTSFSMQKDARMARNGAGKCEMQKSAGYYVTANYERECKSYRPASDETTKKRKDWLNGTD